VSLIKNAALLVVLVFVYDYLARGTRRWPPLVNQLVAGGVLGGVAFTLMAMSWPLSDGVFIDARTVALSTGTLFYGTVPGAIGGSIAAAFRIHQGGPGVSMGVATIAMSVIVAAIWRRVRATDRRDPGFRELWAFGFAVHGCMLCLTCLLPRSMFVDVLQTIAVPVIVVFPLGAALVGTVMVDQRRRRRAERTLRQSEDRFLAFGERFPGRMWMLDDELRYIHVNTQFAEMLGRERSDVLGRTPDDVWAPDVARSLRDHCRRARDGETVDVIEYWPSGGERRWVRALAFSVGGADRGGFIGGLMLDVTDMRQTEAELMRHAERLQQNVRGAVTAMGSLVESRDPYTAGHERRVAELAVAIAERMGWSRDQVEGLRMAALVHDAGKVAVPAEILSRPGRLSVHEFELIKVHARAGYDVLRSIRFDQPVARTVLQHHERLDGSGYPSGLRGDDILPEARVLAVADVFEAMTSHRPYRPALPHEVAVEELRDGAGTRYDVAAVDACLAALEDGFILSSGWDDGRPDAGAGDRWSESCAEGLDLGGVPIAGGVPDTGAVLEEA